MSGAGLATLLGAGVNLASSWYNRKNDMELLQYQNKWNSPVEQMKRGMAAGINPNALAQGIAGSPGYGNMAAADASTVSSAIPNDLGTQIGNSVNNSLQASLTKAEIANVNADTKSKQIENDYDTATFDSRVEQCVNQGVITQSQAKQAKLFAEKYPELLDISVEQAKAQLDKVRKDIDKVEQDIRESEQRIEESRKLIDKYEQDIKTSKSQESKNYAEAALAREKQNLAKEETRNQELKNSNLELSGEESGWKAQYFAIEEKDGKEAADKWLTENMDITEKVVENSSKASAEGTQSVVDETPQGQLKRRYQEAMNKEIKEHERNIRDLRAQMAKVSANSATYRNCRSGIESEKKAIERAERKYRNKMRRVDKGFGAGASAFGFGLNAGG